jgi:hypothetical protein
MEEFNIKLLVGEKQHNGGNNNNNNNNNNDVISLEIHTP